MPFRRNLRFRLTFWNSFIILLAMFLLLAGVRIAVVTHEYRELDSWLLADAQEVSHHVKTIHDPRQLAPFVNDRAEFHSSLKYFVCFRGGNQESFWGTKSTPPELKNASGELKVPLTDWMGFRIAGVRVDRDDLKGHLYVGASTQQILDDVKTADRILLWMGSMALVLIPVLAWTLAGLALRPIRDMVDTAKRMDPEHLSLRFPQFRTKDELELLALTFNTLLDRIDHFVTQRRDLLANAAHEFRTPLAAIRSTAEVALGQHRSVEEYEERLASIIDQGSALEQLVNQLLFLAEAENEQALRQPESVDLHQLIERSTQMFRVIAESKEIQFHFQGSTACVLGNRRHLSMMVNNLIDNALKFTGAGGRVDVQLNHSPDRRNVILNVRDTGMGIEPADIPRVFERFFRTDRARGRGGETPGTGLGLSLVQAIVNAHGGTVVLESQPGIETRFTVTLPVRSSTEAGMTQSSN